MVEIDGKEYPFKLSLGALKDYEEKFDKSFQEAAESGMRITEITFLTFAGLKAGHNIKNEGEFTLTEEDIDNLGISDLNKIMEAVLNEISPDPK